MKTFKAFIKLFEAPQSVETKNQINFFCSSEIGTGRFNVKCETK